MEMSTNCRSRKAFGSGKEKEPAVLSLSEKFLLKGRPGGITVRTDPIVFVYGPSVKEPPSNVIRELIVHIFKPPGLHVPDILRLTLQFKSTDISFPVAGLKPSNLKVSLIELENLTSWDISSTFALHGFQKRIMVAARAPIIVFTIWSSHEKRIRKDKNSFFESGSRKKSRLIGLCDGWG
jgi:hypothetical protein